MTKKIEKLRLHRETVQRLSDTPQPAEAAAAAASYPIRCITDGHFTCVC
ncbi:MAG TPA: hypothetical protein VF615_22455 [Longimicrobiaceae bacterium]|jgi:hypothetical protein